MHTSINGRKRQVHFDTHTHDYCSSDTSYTYLKGATNHKHVHGHTHVHGREHPYRRKHRTVHPYITWPNTIKTYTDGCLDQTNKIWPNSLPLGLWLAWIYSFSTTSILDLPIAPNHIFFSMISTIMHVNSFAAASKISCLHTIWWSAKSS